MNNSEGLPLVVVTNGSACEGYWTVYYLLTTGRCRVRSTVRNLNSARAKILQDLTIEGRKCEVVEAANNDEAGMIKAFSGATGIYATTVYNVDLKKKFDPENLEELEAGRAMIVAAKKTSDTLKCYLWQTMMRFKSHPPDVGLEIPVHFKTKWDLEEEIKAAKLPWVFLRQPAYMRQLRFEMNGKREFKSSHFKEDKIGYVEEEDLGKMAAAILTSSKCNKFLGQTINGLTELSKPADLVDRAVKVTPGFVPEYRQTPVYVTTTVFKMLSWMVGGPGFPYIGAIMSNFGHGNALAMTDEDLQKCRELTEEFGGLSTFEDYLTKYMTEAPHGDAMAIKLQTSFQKDKGTLSTGLNGLICGSSQAPAFLKASGIIALFGGL